MISSLRGTVLRLNHPDSLVVEVGGVGFKVFVPASVFDELDGAKAGRTAFLHTYLMVREDALTLYGFETKEGRQLFSMLLGVNGVGPRLGLAILSTLNRDFQPGAGGGQTHCSKDLDTSARSPAAGSRFAADGDCQ